MNRSLADVVNLEDHALANETFRAQCRQALDHHGVLVLRDFLRPSAVASIQSEGKENQHLAYYTADQHNIYLEPSDPTYPAEHPRNRKVTSSKGCITTDQIPEGSALRLLYDAPEFREFLCSVLAEDALHEYADPLSSINLHYASEGQELGWHFDNSSFAITLLIQRPQSGGTFEYVRNVRDADSGDMNYELTGQILDGKVPIETLSMAPGTLVLFRGRNSMHRVTPVTEGPTRMLAVSPTTPSPASRFRSRRG